MSTLTRLMLALVLCSQIGCGWLGLRDRSNDYLLAEETAPTQVPEGLQGNSLGQVYPIPEIISTTALEPDYEVPRPQPASVNTFEQLVKIQSYEQRSWVLINVPPSEVWPRVRSILSRNGIPTSRTDGVTGMIETVWIKFKSDEQQSHRFRFAIAPGVQLDSTEISALHNQASIGQEESGDWSDSSDSDQREQDMLSLLANELATESNYSQVSLLAQNIGGDAKVSIVADDSQDPHILIALNFDRCWASVSYSASRGGFTVIDKNRSEGVLLVNFSAPSTEEPGFFQRWFGGGKDAEVLEYNHQIRLKTVGGKVQVRVLDRDGVAINASDALRLLAIIRSNLS